MSEPERPPLDRGGQTGRAEWRRPFAGILAVLRQNHLVAAGLGVVVTLVLTGLLAPLIASHPPYETDPTRRLQSPSAEHPLGTDQFGHDILSRVMFGARITLLVALLAVTVGAVAGTALGVTAGYIGGLADEVIMRLMDMLQAFPSFILAMAVAAGVGPGLVTLVVANAVVNIPYYARLLRSKILTLKESQFVSAAICVGNPRSRVVLVHLLPNAMGPLIVQASLQSGWAILSTAGLSFIGLGMRVPAAEWGAMVQVGSRYMVTGQWWIGFFPGLAIVIAVLAFNLIGDGLRDLLDPGGR